MGAESDLQSYSQVVGAIHLVDDRAQRRMHAHEGGSLG